MTYEKLVGAIPAFQKLVMQELPLPTAYRLSKMVRKVNEELDFFRAESEKIRAKHENPNSPEMNRELDALLQWDVEWTFLPLCIDLDDKLRLSCSDVNALDGFIEFVDKEE